MTEPASAQTTKPLPLITRIIGVITSPKAIFENVAAAPRPAGVLLVVALAMSVAQSAPQFTDWGRQASLDMQVKTVERFTGEAVPPEAYARMEESSHNVGLKVLGLAGTFVFLPIASLFFAALFWAIFNTILGGTATFKQVLAVVTHSQVIGALGALAGLPIQLMQQKITMTGPFNLGALAPGLPAQSTLAVFLSGITVFALWGMVVNGIGLGVLYRRSARNIAIVLIVAFLLFMYGLSSVFGSFIGGGQ